jgi:outer membrane protein assembly factor BamA
LLSQGWSLGGGLLLQRQAIDDEDGTAPPSAGLATALVASTGYRDIRFNNYSETGLAFASRIELASEGLGSAYDYQRLSSRLYRSWPLGETPHQTLELQGDFGAYFGGAEGRVRNAFNIGGAQALRGYGRDQAIGDFLYYGSAEYLRPVIWDALRLLVVAEAGSAWPSLSRRDGEPTYASIGVGLRLRINVVVNLQFEIGVAMPVGDSGRGLRVFGGGNS